jgi:3-hydroxyacyl-CoA dehydrogenase
MAPPALMKKVVRSGAKGVANARGFYAYTPEQAKRWEQSFLEFTFDVRRLARKYSLGPQRRDDVDRERAPRRHDARDARREYQKRRDSKIGHGIRRRHLE